MTHSGAGTFDINMPLSGTSGVEDRSDGTENYTLVLTFDTPVNGGTATVTNGTGIAGSPTFSGNDMIIPLSGVTNVQVITVTASNVTNTNGGVLTSASVDMGFLIGDTGADRQVNSSDVSQTKSQSGQPVTASNFREDVTADGTISSSDVSLVKSKTGSALPP